MDDLVGYDNNKTVDVYSAIWLDRFLKKIKLFLWELNLSAISAINTADRHQCRMPYMALSPSWCHMCHSLSEYAAHLFLHCTYVARFWHYILQAFG